MLFAIDAGNTNIHVGIFDGNTLICSFAMGSDASRTPDEYALTLKALTELNGCRVSDIDGVIIGSVVPTLTPVLTRAVKKITSAHLMTVGPGIKTGFHIKIDDPAQLGADLAANTAGAIAEVGYPAFVIDFGTATTVSVIDGSKAFIGCSILPGIQMSLHALNGTGLLPEVSAEKPLSPLGKNSVDAMRAGVIRGQAMTVTGFIDLYRESNPAIKDASVVVTGGSAESLIPYLPEDLKYIPDLTLKGLNAIYNANKR